MGRSKVNFIASSNTVVTRSRYSIRLLDDGSAVLSPIIDGRKHHFGTFADRKTAVAAWHHMADLLHAGEIVHQASFADFNRLD
jgi:hypothetical protein